MSIIRRVEVPRCVKDLETTGQGSALTTTNLVIVTQRPPLRQGWAVVDLLVDGRP